MQGFYRGPEDHINTRILFSAFKSQYHGDTRNHGLWDPSFYILYYAILYYTIAKIITITIAITITTTSTITIIHHTNITSSLVVLGPLFQPSTVWVRASNTGPRSASLEGRLAEKPGALLEDSESLTWRSKPWALSYGPRIWNITLQCILSYYNISYYHTILNWNWGFRLVGSSQGSVSYGPLIWNPYVPSIYHLRIRALTVNPTGIRKKQIRAQTKGPYFEPVTPSQDGLLGLNRDPNKENPGHRLF